MKPVALGRLDAELALIAADLAAVDLALANRETLADAQIVRLERRRASLEWMKLKYEDERKRAS